MKILVTGGARSGKSAFAEKLAKETEKKTAYLATAQAVDEEMKKRIGAHQKRRPEGWMTVEWQKGFSGWTDGVFGTKENAVCKESAFQEAELLLLDSLGMLVNNALYHAGEAREGAGSLREGFIRDMKAFMDWCRAQGKDLIMVTEEVGLGLVPEYPLGRLYRDFLGEVNQAAAAASERVYLVVAGLPLQLK